MKHEYVAMLVVFNSVAGVVFGIHWCEGSRFHFKQSECKITEVLSEDQTIVLKQLTCKHTVVSK